MYLQQLRIFLFYCFHLLRLSIHLPLPSVTRWLCSWYLINSIVSFETECYMFTGFISGKGNRATQYMYTGQSVFTWRRNTPAAQSTFLTRRKSEFPCFPPTERLFLIIFAALISERELIVFCETKGRILTYPDMESLPYFLEIYV